jgi:hypothetical protein
MLQMDALAEQPMPGLDSSASIPIPLSIRTAPVIRLPAPAGTGPVGVLSGYPQTPAGALAQLASLIQTSTRSDIARAAIAAWAEPGGPTPRTWSHLQTIDAIPLVYGDGSAAPPTVVITPKMGLVKGTVGDGFAVVCVDSQVDVRAQQRTLFAVATCQRMVWHQDRWLIGAGAEPYAAPAAWPDTDAAIDVGYSDLERGP